MLIEARNGPDRIEIFPEVDDEDDLGNPRRVPSEIPVVLHVALHGLAASEFNLLGTAEMSAMGQQTNSMLTFITAEKVPAGAWAVIKARGRLWDVVGEPIRSPRMKITRVILRARDPEPAYARY